MKKSYIIPRSEALTLDGQELICASDVPGDVTLPIDGSAIGGGIITGDSRMIDLDDE